MYIIPVCATQGGGGSFKIAHYRRLVAVRHASQSNGPKSCWRQRSVVVGVVVLVLVM